MDDVLCAKIPEIIESDYKDNRISKMELNLNLRKVEYWTKNKNHKNLGYFHTWGCRADECGSEFFGIVEQASGELLELDAIQIRFMDRA